MPKRWFKSKRKQKLAGNRGPGSLNIFHTLFHMVACFAPRVDHSCLHTYRGGRGKHAPHGMVRDFRLGCAANCDLSSPCDARRATKTALRYVQVGLFGSVLCCAPVCFFSILSTVCVGSSRREACMMQTPPLPSSHPTAR